MKRFIKIVYSFLFVISLTACYNKEPQTQSEYFSSILKQLEEIENYSIDIKNKSITSLAYDWSGVYQDISSIISKTDQLNENTNQTEILISELLSLKSQLILLINNINNHNSLIEEVDFELLRSQYQILKDNNSSLKTNLQLSGDKLSYLGELNKPNYNIYRVGLTYENINNVVASSNTKLSYSITSSNSLKVMLSKYVVE